MYYLIEDSPKGTSIIGIYDTQKQAQEKLNTLDPESFKYCNYYISEVIIKY